MKREIVAAIVVLLGGPLYASTITVVARTSDGDPLPSSRVNLLALSETGAECRVVQQTVANEQGRASLTLTNPGLYMIAVELAGFVGTEVGPFRVEGAATSDSDAPATFTLVLHTACDICVEKPVVNEYLLAKRCGAVDPAQAGAR